MTASNDHVDVLIVGATPWRLHQNYARDLVGLRLGAIDDGALVFTPARPAVEDSQALAA